MSSPGEGEIAASQGRGRGHQAWPGRSSGECERCCYYLMAEGAARLAASQGLGAAPVGPVSEGSRGPRPGPSHVAVSFAVTAYSRRGLGQGWALGVGAGTDSTSAHLSSTELGLGPAEPGAVPPARRGRPGHVTAARGAVPQESAARPECAARLRRGTPVVSTTHREAGWRGRRGAGRWRRSSNSRITWGRSSRRRGRTLWVRPLGERAGPHAQWGWGAGREQQPSVTLAARLTPGQGSKPRPLAESPWSPALACRAGVASATTACQTWGRGR